MMQRIRRFDPLQTAKVAAVMYGLMGLLFVPIFMLISSFAPLAPTESVFGMRFAIALPLIYAAVGFVGTLIAAALYNAVAGWIGGIAIELTVDS